MKRSKQRTLFEFDVFAKTKKWELARIPSLLVVRMSNVAISDEMAPALMAVLQCECVTRWMWWRLIVVTVQPTSVTHDSVLMLPFSYSHRPGVCISGLGQTRWDKRLAIFHILTKLNYLSTLYVGTSVRWAGWANWKTGWANEKIFFGASRPILSNKCLPTLAWKPAGAPGVCRLPASTSSACDFTGLLYVCCSSYLFSLSVFLLVLYSLIYFLSGSVR